MKLAFDHQIFTLQSYGGISRYFVRLAQGLLSLGEEVNILAPLHRNRYLREIPVHRVYGLEVKRFPPKCTRIIAAINRPIGSMWVNRHGPDVLHETYYTANPLGGHCDGRILTVYDMIHERFAKEFAVRDPTSRNKRLAVSRADHIICISHSTKNDLCQLFDVPADKVSVVHLGFDKFEEREFRAPAGTSVRPYLLYVGLRVGYKNFERLLQAVASRPALQNAFDIVAFGGGQISSNERKLINALGFRPDAIRQIGGDDNTLGKLYSFAAAFVYPSLYEGFGLPPLEAMAHDCPVITSNTSSMPEVVGPAGEYFMPTDIEAQAEAISNVVFDGQRRDELVLEGRKRLKQFSWARCAAETRDVYQAVLGSKESR
jgi:glycosyltransferase involved in cell wall biosynthesis